MWIICDSLLSVVSRGVGCSLKLVKMLFLMMISLLCLVRFSR